MKKILLLSALTVCVSTPALSAEFLDGDLSGTVGFVSDYVFRGISQSDSHPAVQGSIDYSHSSGLYAGIWGSNIDFDDGDEASLETDIYGGWSGEYKGFSLDTGLIYYAYPGADSDLNYDYYEVTGSAGYDFDVFSLTGAVNYSPDYFAGSGDAWYLAANADVPLPYDFKVGAHYGHQFIDENDTFGSPDYSDWSLELGYTYQKVDFSLKYTDTSLKDGTDCVSGWCDSKVVLGVSYKF